MNWLIFILMLPHLKPKCLSYLFPTLRLAFEVGRVVSLLVVLCLCLRRKKLPSLPTWLLGVLEGWICLITLINRGDYVQTFSLAVSVMGIVLLVDLYADRMEELISALMLNFEWVVYANLYTVIRWPDQGIVWDTEYNLPIYFFGPDNWFMYLCIPAVCVGLLYLRVRWARGNRPLGVLRAGCLIAASYTCVLLQWPATAVAALAGLAVVLLVGLIPGVRYCVTFPVVLVGGIAADLAVSVFRVMETVPAVSDLIQNVLKKNVTLSGRDGVWDGFWQLIDGHWLTGIGMPKGGYPVQERFYDHMHNVPFDLLIQGGIPALLLFLAVVLLVGWVLTRHAKTPSAKIMTAAMAALFLMGISEVCRQAAIYLLIPLAYHARRMEEACAPQAPSAEDTAA